MAQLTFSTWSNISIAEIAHNLLTNILIGNIQEGGANCTWNMLYYQDILVFTSCGYGSVRVLDANTGEILQREHRFEDSSYTTDIAYDAETDMFFTFTYEHAVGFKIKKSN